MKPKFRNLIHYLFYSIGFLFVIGFLYCSIKSNDSENTIAAASLLIALISLFITTNSYNQQIDSKLPQIIVDMDFGSRYGLMLLSIKNYGEMTAFAILIEWDKPMLNYKGENLFGQNDSKLIRIPVLQKNQDLKIMIDGVSDFYSKYSDIEMQFSGKIKFSTSKNKKYYLTNNFTLDLSIYRKTLTYESESLKAFYEMQKIPKFLESMIEVIKNK